MKIWGDYHTHTDGSDGSGSIEAMVKVAAERKLEELAITDHAHGKLFRGFKQKNYARAKALLEKAGADHGVRTFFGVEANITGVNGEIDVRPKHRNVIEILCCGVHRIVKPANIRSYFTYFIPNYFWSFLHFTPKGRIRKNTEVVKRAIEKNNIDILTHPGRYFKVDVVEIAKVCAERGTLMELNGKKISFRPIDFERMLAVGAKFIINSDAHSPRYVGSADRCFEFLKSCDWKQEDIVNLSGPYKRIAPKLLEAVKEKEEKGAEVPPMTDKERKKKEKEEKKKKKKK